MKRFIFMPFCLFFIFETQGQGWRINKNDFIEELKNNLTQLQNKKDISEKNKIIINLSGLPCILYDTIKWYTNLFSFIYAALEIFILS